MAVPCNSKALDSPGTLKRKYEVKCKGIKKKLKISQQTIRRLRKRVSNMEGIIKVLKDKQMISDDCKNLLEKSLSGVPLEIIKRMLSKKADEYPPELRSFAMTLQFYLTKAYNYVRKTFCCALSNPSTIRKWYSKLNCEPGFTQDVFRVLTAKVLKEAESGHKVVCSLMMDEMSIKKQLEWDGSRFRGYVDLGTGIDDDELPYAKEALVMMVVSMNGSWKVPVGYFLIEGLNGEERANLVKECLIKLHESGVVVPCIICDGPTCNIAMMEKLGAVVSCPNKLYLQNFGFYLRPDSQHPADETIRVSVMLDACHMLKLIRNGLAAYKVLVDKDGRLIKWKYFEELEKVQNSEGLRLGNKLRRAHIEWKNKR